MWASGSIASKGRAPPDVPGVTLTIHAVTLVIVDADKGSGHGGHGGLDDGGWSVMLHRQTLYHIGGSVVNRPQP